MVIRVPISLANVRVRMDLRTAAVSQWCAELYGTYVRADVRVVSPTVCVTVGYSRAERYRVCTCAISSTVCGRGSVVC